MELNWRQWCGIYSCPLFFSCFSLFHWQEQAFSLCASCLLSQWQLAMRHCCGSISPRTLTPGRQSTAGHSQLSQKRKRDAQWIWSIFCGSCRQILQTDQYMFLSANSPILAESWVLKCELGGKKGERQETNRGGVGVLHHAVMSVSDPAFSLDTGW